MPPSAAPHPTADRLLAFARGRLAEEEQETLIAHLDTCSDCVDRLGTLPDSDPFIDGLRSAGRVTAAPLVPSPSASAPPPTIAGYQILQELGRGGMGVVYRAFDEKLHRPVAVKVMAAALAVDAEARQRFIREARSAAAVAHDNVVRIFAVEESGPVPYLVMELVTGESLAQRLDRDGALPTDEILRVGQQVAAGLTAAHARGLIHRDVKPANILLEEGTGRVVLTDFGLARAADEATLTQSGVLAGTPQYMSPEQAEGLPLDARSDLFSLGSVLYAMCTGVAPFRAAGPLAVLRRVADKAPPPVGQLNPHVPQVLADLVARLHAKNPAQRTASAREVVDRLTRIRAEPAVPAARPRRGAVIVGMAVVLVAGLCLAELAGVTHLAAMVWRPRPPVGTRLVELAPTAIPGHADGPDLGPTALLTSPEWEWTSPVKLDRVNSDADDNAPSLSADGLTLLFVTTRRGHGEIWQARRDSRDEPFGTPTPLSEVINLRVGNQFPYVGTPHLSADGRQLLFASNRPGGRGGTDLWVSRRADDHADWKPPTNLGPGVNSPGLEYAPSLAHDGLTLVWFCPSRENYKIGELWGSRRATTDEPFGPRQRLRFADAAPTGEQSPHLTADGRTLLFDRGGVHPRLWQATRPAADVAFGPPVPLQLPWGEVNAHACSVSADGRLLVFCSNRENGEPGWGYGDLWMARRVPKTPSAAAAAR